MKPGTSVIKFLTGREIGCRTEAPIYYEDEFSKPGNACEQVTEERATIPTKNQACEFSGQTRSTFLMAFSPDGSKMASTHGDHNVRITDLGSGKCVHTLKGHPRTPWCVAFHPVSNDILASGCLGGEVRIWDLRGGGSEVWRSEKNLSIASMAFHPFDQVLVFAVANEVHFWDWTEPQPFATATTAYEYEKVRWVRFDPHGYHLYTGIGNGVSVHQQQEERQPEVGHIGSSSGSYHTAEERAQLQTQYRRILDEINQLRRERLQVQSELAGGSTSASSSSSSATPAASSSTPVSVVSGLSSATVTSTSVSAASAQPGVTGTSGPQPSSTLPRPPSPVHVDALVNARMYASAVTHAQYSRDRPGQSDSPATSTDVQSLLTSGSPRIPRVIHIRRITTQTSTASGQGQSILVTADNTPTVSSIVASSESSLGILRASGRQAPSRLSSFLRSQLTSLSTTATTASTSGLVFSSSATASATRPTSSLSVNNTITPVTVLSVPQANPLGSTTATFPQRSLSSRLASAFQAQSSLTPRPSVSLTTTSSTSSTSSTFPGYTGSESVRERFMSFLNSRATSNSNSSEDHFQCAIGRCQVCRNFPSMLNTQQPSPWSPSTRTVPIVPRRVSRSTNGREGPVPPRPRHRTHRLAGLLESEVRQALDQVQARRSDISETLRELDSLREELNTHNCPTGSSTNPQSNNGADETPNAPSNDGSEVTSSAEQVPRVEEDEDLPSSQESIDPIDSLLEIGNEPATSVELQPSSSSAIEESLVDAVDQPLVDPDSQPSTPTAEQDSMDLDASSQGSSSSQSSIGSMESIPSSQDDGSSSDATLRAIGSYSSEIERRVHELDQRISDIQGRLQLRLQALQQQRERHSQVQRVQLSSVPRCLGISERIRRRHERLRVHLQDLRRRYQTRVRNARERQAQRDATDTAARPRRTDRNAQVRRELDRIRDSQESNDADSTTANLGSSAASDTSVSSTTPASSTSSLLGRIGRTRSSTRCRIHSHHTGPPPSSAARLRAEMQRNRQAARERQRSWHQLQRRHLHPHYSVSILDETINRPDDGLQAAINRAIAGAFIASGETGVASNIINTTFRIQRWEFSRGSIPDIKNSQENVIVPHCKLHNDAYCDISQDGRCLAVFVPSHHGFPDDSVLAVFSLATETFKQCLFTKSFGPNFVSVSISPLNNYVLVGLATRRLAWVFTPRQMVAQVYKLKKPSTGEDSMEHVCDLMHPCDMDIRTPVSVNSARWLPFVGEGIVYGTNRGDLHICRPGFEHEEKRNDSDNHQESGNMRPNWFMNMLGLNVPRTASTSTQTVQRVRRTASTQTDLIESDDST